MSFPTLVLPYRNDPGATLSPDHFYHLGDTEWQDVVLYGWSMGCCIVETFLRRSSYVAKVRAVVLDSPLLDWPKSLDAQVHLLHFPHWFTDVLKWFIEQRAGINFAALTYVRPAPQRTTPTLLFQGAADAQVPIVSSDLMRSLRGLWRRLRQVDMSLIFAGQSGLLEEGCHPRTTGQMSCAPRRISAQRCQKGIGSPAWMSLS